ncbi:trypsin-like peptidase domain-containing protein [Streptomyces sp. JW3]|uniref:S1C family serine protease n=1 Tax=Streptomyces sp. JW3 TaxID=3456955 RepID=UPI003FA4113C
MGNDGRDRDWGRGPGYDAGDDESARPGMRAGFEAESGAEAGSEATSETGLGSGAAAPAPDPDGPHDTPPYGRPGPWAPAPPVRHPAAPPVADAPAPAVPSPTAGVPAPAVPSPTAGVPAPAVPSPTAGVPAPAVPSPTAGVPAPAVPSPTAGVPAPAVPSPTAGVPAPAVPSPTAGVPAPAVPSPTAGVPAPAVPPTAPGAQPPGGLPTAPTAAPPTAPPPAGHHPAPAPDPWARYDPWAVAQRSAMQRGAAFRGDGTTGAGRTSPRRRRFRKALVGPALLLAVASGLAGGVVGTYLERNGGLRTVELPQAGKAPAGRDPDSVAGIAARALPGVVTLHVSGAEQAGTGTGFVLDTRGHILTNNHVVEPAGPDGVITVTFHSGDTAEATVVGRDSGYDLAVVEVSGVRGLSPVPLGNSDNVRVGDPVVAIGAPFDLAGTVTAGIISATERPITAGGEKADGSDVSYVDALQTDAPINPGNSGGPLLDAAGRVVGINSAIRSADGATDPEGGQAGSIGLGFAIPVNQGRRVAEELINTGRATHPVIGVTLDMGYTGDGARVGTGGGDGGPAVTEGGPGDRAGLRPGDVITAVDGRRIHSGEELIVRTRAHRPGDRLALTLERDGEVRKVSLTLGSSAGD